MALVDYLGFDVDHLTDFFSFLRRGLRCHHQRHVARSDAGAPMLPRARATASREKRPPRARARCLGCEASTRDTALVAAALSVSSSAAARGPSNRCGPRARRGGQRPHAERTCASVCCPFSSQRSEIEGPSGRSAPAPRQQGPLLRAPCTTLLRQRAAPCGVAAAPCRGAHVAPRPAAIVPANVLCLAL